MCPASCYTWRSAKTCSSRCRRAPRRRWPVPPCWSTCQAARSRSAGRRTGAAGPLGIGAVPGRVRLRGGRRGRVHHRLGLGRTDDDLGERPFARESERFPRGATPVADVDLELLRAERIRQGTFDDNRRRHASARSRSASWSFDFDPPTAISGCGASSNASRLCRRIRLGWTGLLRGLQHPGRRVGTTAAGPDYRRS